MTSWPWSTLGLDGPATEAEIRKAYAARLRVTRPDEDAEGFQALVEARDAAMARAAGKARRPQVTDDPQPDRRKTRKNKEPELPPTPDLQAFLAAIEHLREAPDEATRRVHWRDILTTFDALGLADVAVARRMIRNEIAREIERPESGAEWTPFYPPSVLRDRSRKAELWVTMINDWIDHVQPEPLHRSERVALEVASERLYYVVIHMCSEDLPSMRASMGELNGSPYLFEPARERLATLCPAWKSNKADWENLHDAKTLNVGLLVVPLAYLGWRRRYRSFGLLGMALMSILYGSWFIGAAETRSEKDSYALLIGVPVVVLFVSFFFAVLPLALSGSFVRLRQIFAQVFKLAAKGPTIQELEQKMVAYVAPDRLAGAFGLIFMIVFVVAELYLLKG